MGCLLELIFTIFIEGIFELINHCFIKLMQWIVPDKIVSEKTTKTLRNFATTIAVLSALALIIGGILTIQEDPSIKNIGERMTYIPLQIIVLQILLGIVMRIIGRFKK